MEDELNRKRADNSYRYFNNINRIAKDFPMAHQDNTNEKVTVWCSNDYCPCLNILKSSRRHKKSSRCMGLVQVVLETLQATN